MRSDQRHMIRSPSPPRTISRNIGKRMAAGKINRMRLSLAAGMAWNNLDAILRERSTPTIPTLERIAAALTALGVETTVADLFEEAA